MATKDWQTLTKLTGGGHIEIQRVRLVEQDVAIEGPFELPPLAQLSAEDQIFVAAFVRCHGSIKQMEKFFGVSYPTIKNRLNRIGAQLPFVEVEPAPEPEAKRATADDLLSKLERGEMSVRDVIAKLKTPSEGDRS
ncbi:MAG TPA: DUF2089 family protein [Vicinamibacterales bacterium]|nr:DUF2089 family protein [Vicinamibacterales bacterium]